MSEAAIPVDLHNPGQVFACLGFLEAAALLLGRAEGGFDWNEGNADLFRLRVDGPDNPVEAVLEFLAEAKPRELIPIGWRPPTKKGKNLANTTTDEDGGSPAEEESGLCLERVETSEFVAGTADKMSLPIMLGGGNRPSVALSHWTDGSSRNPFKLYSGNRTAAGIAAAMLSGKHDKKGKVLTKGIRQLFEEQRQSLIAGPFHVLTPMGGSFNFDPRGAWTGLDAGYSPNDQDHDVLASPVVELLAAWGLEHARPDEFRTRDVRYAVGRHLLPPVLARAVLGGAPGIAETRHFRFHLDLSGKNKVVSFAQEEFAP